MYEYNYSAETTATPEAIYHLFQDVTTWPSWDTGLERVDLFGPFAAGTSGKMKLFDQEPFDFSLISVEPNRGFVDVTPLPEMGITVTFVHILTPLANGGTRITWQIKVDGTAADEVGPMISGDTPEAVANLIWLAESVRAS